MIVRGGEATISDSNLISLGTYSIDPENDEYYKFDTAWTDGNDVPYATLVVGNRCSGSYDYTTKCDVTNTTISMKLNEGNSKAVVIYVASDNGKRVDLNIDESYANEIISEKNYWGVDTYLNGMKLSADESGNAVDSIKNIVF